MPADTPIPGYTYGQPSVAQSPITLDELRLIADTIDFTDQDKRYLELAGAVLRDRVDDYLDRWYAFAATRPHLGLFSANAAGEPLPEYRQNARLRFRQWILDTCFRPFDQTWLDYQHEIGLRHHRTKKNQTDNADAPPIINFRYIVAQVYPFATMIRPILAESGQPPDDVERMTEAWHKAVLLQVILWSYPYIKEGDF